MDLVRLILSPVLVLIAAVMIGAGIVILVKNLKRLQKTKSR
ncbi:MAG: hypothetical protein ACE5HZ_05805 [Fidelibacterota bacterium]